MTDTDPQGKDLYDAVLLAEYTTVQLDLLRELMRPGLGAAAARFTPESVLSLDVDWDDFRQEKPDVEGTAEAWLRRLVVALNKTN